MNEIEQIKDRLDIVEVISSYLTLKRAGTNMKANCPFHNEKTPSFMVSPERQSFKCFGCFPSGQKIQTKDGLKEIQEINTNDYVYTHKGRLKRVKMTFERNYTGDMIEITPRMLSAPIKLTGDHNVYTIKTINCKQNGRKTRICRTSCKQSCPTKYFENYKIEKVPARDLKKDDYLLYPVKNHDKYYENKTIDIFKYTGSDYKRGRKPGDYINNVRLDEKFARLAGFYIAEGSNHRAYIRFSLGGHEKKYADEIVSLISQVFGLSASIHIRKGKKTGIEVTCCNSLLSREFEVLFGKGSENKQIPYFFMTAERGIKVSLLSAIIDGDGTIIKQKDKKTKKRISISTTSECLTYQLVDLLISLEKRPSLSSKSSYSVGEVNHKKSYRINWLDDNNKHFSDFYSKKGVKYWLLPIRKISKQDFKGYVYNLNIEDDHSYLTKSFSVSNCGEGGDIFTFIEKIEGVDFYNALKILADKAGVELKPQKISHGGREYKPDQKTRLFEINDWAKKVYHKILLDHPKAEKARKYLKKRGMSQKTIKEFEIGYAPDSWDFIIKFLKSKEYTESEMAKAGIVVPGKKGSHYDRFRDRITFPINNVMGNTVAFTSRTMKPDSDPKAGAKYINSSESPIYHKGKILYGLDKAKMEIKREELAVMVEGNMDVIACHQAGFKNVVATSGTAIGAEQLKILTRYAKDVAFSFDSDTAGVIAMKRAIVIALENDVSVRIIDLPKAYKDPDEAIKADPKNWTRAVANAKPALEHWIDLLILSKKNLSVVDKKDIAKEILPVIKNIYSDIEKEHYIKYLSLKLSVSEKALVDSLKKTKVNKKLRSPKNEEFQTQKLSDVERMLGIIYKDFDLFGKLDKKDLGNLAKLKNDEKYGDVIEKLLAEKEISNGLKEVGEQLVLTIEKDYSEASSDDLLAELKFLIQKIGKNSKEKIKEIYAGRIKAAEESGDFKQVSMILREFSELIKE